ncbi:MAG: DinB family protein, partial [bacterium]|nr:DinB family protein [bacterium]
MSVATPAVSIGQHLPWVNMTLDYTEQLVEKMPEELLDFRPVDPNGHYMFSLGEIAMHLADTRRMFARTLAGSESTEGYWTNWDEDTEHT